MNLIGHFALPILIQLVVARLCARKLEPAGQTPALYLARSRNRNIGRSKLIPTGQGRHANDGAVCIRAPRSISIPGPGLVPTIAMLRDRHTYSPEDSAECQ